MPQCSWVLFLFLANSWLRLYGSLKRLCAPPFPRIRENVASAAVRTATGTCAVVWGDQNGSGDQSGPGEKASSSFLWLVIGKITSFLA